MSTTSLTMLYLPVPRVFPALYCGQRFQSGSGKAEGIDRVTIPMGEYLVCLFGGEHRAPSPLAVFVRTTVLRDSLVHIHRFLWAERLTG